MRPERVASLAVLLGTLAVFVYAAVRVYELERNEVAYVSASKTLQERVADLGSTRISARLGSVQLQANQHAIFELCAPELSDATFLNAFDLAVIQLDRKQLMLRVPLDPAHLAKAKRNRRGGCLRIGSGLLEHSGTYTVEAVFGERPPPERAATIPLAVRVMAKTDLVPLDRALVLALGLLLVTWLGLQLRAAAPAPLERPSAEPSWLETPRLRVAGWAALAVALIFSASELPLPGPTLTLIKGIGMLALQCGLALVLSRLNHSAIEARELLALRRPERPRWVFGASLASWPLLVGASMLALRIVPSTGEAPIETFISWPSGMLAAALLGVFLPLGEELFFRGYLFGALSVFGRGPAIALNVLVFGSLHALQSWGNWGGLVSVFAAGLVFLGLRLASGSVLVPAFVHIAYNLTLSLTSLRGAGGS